MKKPKLSRAMKKYIKDAVTKRGVLMFPKEVIDRTLSEKLYGVGFEKPLIKPTNLEIISAMIDRGYYCVPCWVSDNESVLDPYSKSVLINYITEEGYFIDTDGNCWIHATPFDHHTGDAITELPE